MKNVKNLENFYKSIQILVSLSEAWTCNLMITSLVSYPLDHRGKLENLAVYVYSIIKIQKFPLLANEMYKLHTHFGFTNLCSKVTSFCPVSSQKVKNGTRTPCTLNAVFTKFLSSDNSGLEITEIYSYSFLAKISWK